MLVGTQNRPFEIAFESQAVYGDILSIEVAARDFSPLGCDFVYRVNNPKTGVEIARAKTGILCFNYTLQKVAKCPEKFLASLGQPHPVVTEK